MFNLVAISATPFTRARVAGHASRRGMHGLLRLDRVVDETICPVVMEDPVELVLVRRHVAIISHTGPDTLEVLLGGWPSVGASGRVEILSLLVTEVAYDPVRLTRGGCPQ